MKAAMEATGATEGFLNSVAPASCARIGNEFYETDEEIIWACADAMREEYQAIVDAGLTVQLDDPAIAENWDQIVPEPSVEAYRRFTKTRIDALNHAIRGLPPERIRFHLCWGSWHGPHVTDIAMADIVDLMLEVNASAYSFEAANARHEHEWRVWEDVTLPDGKVILPGIVTHSTNVVEHPELVAERIGRFAGLVGAGERDRLDRLRARRANPPADRLGEARVARPGRGDREQAGLSRPLDSMGSSGVSLIATAARPTFVVARQTTWSEFPSLWRSMLDEVYAVVKPAGAGRAGGDEERWQNVMLYKDDVPNVEVGVLASGPFSDAGNVISSALPAGVTAVATHRGPYAELDLTHRAVREWCAANGRRLAGPRWEIYGHWREDPSDLETEVSYLLG